MNYLDCIPSTKHLDQSMSKKVYHALEIIQQPLTKYKIEEVALSFNGGKDCCVLLHLLSLVLSSKHIPFLKLKIIYFLHANSFPEVDTFVHQCVKIYNANISFISTPIKPALDDLVNNHGVKAIFMGTRSTDPRSATLKEFAPTDTQFGWPAFVRINPILSWAYEDVWNFIRSLDVPYCELYDRGYTSIGSTIDTIPNPALKTGAGFDPAYKLTDGSQERSGRLSG